MTKQKTIYYKKPQAICLDVDSDLNHIDKQKFILKEKSVIEDHFKQLGFYIRKGEINDVNDLNVFVRKSYKTFGEDVVNDVSPYDIYRFTKFGNTVILEDQYKELVGCIFEIGYDTTDKVSYTIRLALNTEIKGKNLGFFLSEYSCLLAMERGSLVKRGLMETDNLASFNILINKTGWICDGFETDLHCGIDNGFTVSLPLTPEGLKANRIDKEKITGFIKNKIPGKDYLLIDVDAIDEIKQLYDIGDFWIVALLRKGLISNKNQFLAIPVKELNIR